MFFRSMLRIHSMLRTKCDGNQTFGMLEYSVEVLPWQDFLERLWFGEHVV